MLRLIDGACAVGAGVAAISAALLAVLFVVEVVATSFLSWSQPWAVEYSIYLQAFILFCGAGWALRQGGHIRVAILLQLAPPGVARTLDLAGTTFALGVIGYATYALIQQTARTIGFGSVSYYPMQTPLWVPQAVLTAGFVLLTLAFAARLIRLVRNEPVEHARGLGGGGHE